MKTPREILFARHRKVEPKLDALREKTIQGLTTASEAAGTRASRAERRRGGLLRTLWLELIWPCRRAWGGMAIVWLAVGTANLAMKPPHSSATLANSAPAPNVAKAFGEQRQLLAELLPPGATTPPQVKRKAPNNKPRSERRVLFKAC